MKKKGLKLFYILMLLVVAAICGILFVCEYIAANQEIGEYRRLEQTFTDISHAMATRMKTRWTRIWQMHL